MQNLSKIFIKPWGKGAFCGFILAVVIMVVSIFDLSEGTPLQSAILFLGTLPIFIIMKLGSEIEVFEFFIAFVLFGYWIILGAFIGWCLSKGKRGTELVFF